jgi:hypothetical protein
VGHALEEPGRRRVEEVVDGLPAEAPLTRMAITPKDQGVISTCGCPKTSRFAAS